MSREDKLADLKSKYAMLQADKLAFFETSQWTLKQCTETAHTIASENDMLRERLVAVRASSEHKAGSVTNSSTQNIDTATGRVPFETFKRLSEAVLEAKRQLDSLREEARMRAREVQLMEDDVRYVELEKNVHPDEETARRRLRELENRLDKALIKYNEALSIRKTYEGIVERLKRDKIGHSATIEEMTAELAEKTRECGELVVLANDAKLAQEIAQSDLAKAESEHAEVRRARLVDLKERQNEVAELTAANEKARAKKEAQHNGEVEEAARVSKQGSEVSQDDVNLRKVAIYEEAERRMQDASGLKDINDIIAKFLSQEGTHANMLQMSKEAEKRIVALTDERNAAKAALDELRYNANGPTSSRRVIEEFEAHISSARQKLELSKSKYERINVLYLTSRAGVDHLDDKLASVPLERPVVTSKNEDPVVDLLTLCEHKLSHLIAALRMQGIELRQQHLVAHRLGSYAANPNNPTPMTQSPHNTRVDLAHHVVDNQAPSSDEDDEAVLSRAAVKMRGSEKTQPVREKKTKTRATAK